MIWSFFDRELDFKRFNYLTNFYYAKFGHPDYKFLGFKMARWELRHYSWYYRYVAPFTIVGQAYYAKHRHFVDLVRQRKNYEQQLKEKDDEIERLNAIIKVKDVYIEMYNRKI